MGIHQDEFNQNHVINDKALHKAEFGSTQSSEFSDSGEMHLHKSAYNADLNKTLTNAPKETFIGASSSEASASASGATATTISAGTSASTIAAGSASAIVVASSVAVTAISVVTGVSVALHDYQCEVSSLFVSSNQMTYELTIEDLRAKDEGYEFDYQSYEEQPCSIRVYNKYYDKTQKLDYGYNSNSFENLTLGQQYNIIVTADSVSGKKTLYQETFTTAAVANFLDFYVDSGYDPYNSIFYVYMDFVDEIDQLSDFNLAITRVFEPIEEEEYEPESYTVNFPLEEKAGTQEVNYANSDLWIEPDVQYLYEFSYIRNNEKIVFRKGDVYFHNAFEGTNEVYGVNFNNEANYKDGTFVLNLIYTDSNNVFDNFVLHLTGPEGRTIDIELAKTIDPQVINAMEYKIDFSLQYEAYLTYTRLDIEERKDLLPFTFADNSDPKSAFNRFIFSGDADFVEMNFDVQLDYFDDFNIYHNFVLRIFDFSGDFDFEFDLEETRETQTIDAPEILYEETLEYQYELTCDENAVHTILDSGTVHFRDKFNRQAVFNALIINEIANLETNEFTVRLDYIDTFDAFDNFSLNMSSESATMGGSYDFVLAKTTEEQKLQGDDVGMVLLNGPFNYILTAERFGYEEILATGTIVFSNEEGQKSEFEQLFFNQKMNYETGEFSITLLYQDDFDFFSEFSIRFYNDDTEFDETIDLEKTLESQTFLGFELGFEMDGTYTYVFSYRSQGQLISFDPVTFTFEDVYGRVSEFNAFIVHEEADFLTNKFQVEIDYSDSFGVFTDFKVTFFRTSSTFSADIPLQNSSLPQTIDGSDYGMVLRNYATYEYELTCLKNGSFIIIDSGSVTFTDTSGASSEFKNFIFDGTANRLTDTFTVQLDYVDDFNLFSDFVLTFTENDTAYESEVNLEKTTEEQEILMMEYDLQFDVSYNYVLSCTYDGSYRELKTDTFTFTDNSGAVSQFNGMTVSSAANFQTRTFQITLNYQDDFNYFSDFTLILKDHDTDTTKEFPLRKTTEAQDVTVDESEWNSEDYIYEYPVDILDHSVTYSLTYEDENNGVISPIYENQLPAFTNSLVTEFNGLESSWVLVQDPNYTDHYYIPMKLDYVDYKRIYGVLEIIMYINDDQIGTIEFQNEVTPTVGDWINGSVSTELSLEDLTSYPITFSVEGQLLSEKNHDVTVDDHAFIHEETHNLTYSNDPAFYALTAEQTISGGSAYFHAFFAGAASSFANCQIIIETSDDTYTYNITLTGSSDYISVDLNYPNETTFDSEQLAIIFGEPVTIKFSYCTVVSEGSNPGDTGTLSDPVIVVCYTSYKFEVSV